MQTKFLKWACGLGIGIIPIVIMVMTTVFAQAATLGEDGTVPYPFYTSMQTQRYNIDGEMAFCLNASRTRQPDGIVTSQATSANVDLIKCLYYGYGGEGNLMTDLSVENQITYTHLMASHIYANDMRGFSFYTLDRYMNCNLIDYFNQLPILRDPNYHELYFTSSDIGFFDLETRLVSDSVGLHADENTFGYFNLPDGITLVNETENIRTTGTTAYLESGDLFHFEAERGIAISECDLEFVLNGNLYDYTVTLAKVLGTVDVENPDNDSYQTIGSLTRTSRTLKTNIHLKLQENGGIRIKTRSNMDNPVANAPLTVSGANGYSIMLRTDESGEVNLPDMSPGSYLITPREIAFPYSLISKTYYANVIPGEEHTVTIEYLEYDNIDVIYYAPIPDLILKEEQIPIGEDYHTSEFSQFNLNDYKPLKMWVEQEGRTVFETENEIELKEGFQIAADDFGDYVNFDGSGYYLEILYDLEQLVFLRPEIIGHDGTLRLSQINPENIDYLIRDCTGIRGVDEGQEVGEQIKTGSYSFGSFQHDGIVAIEFSYMSKHEYYITASYNVRVIDDLKDESTYQIRFIDSDHFKSDSDGNIVWGRYSKDYYFRTLLDRSLKRVEPLVSYEIDNYQRKRIKANYLRVNCMSPEIDWLNEDLIKPELRTVEDVRVSLGGITNENDLLKSPDITDNQGNDLDKGALISWSTTWNNEIIAKVAVPDEFIGTKIITIPIVKRNIENGVVTAVPDQNFTGKPLDLKPLIYFEGRRLIENADYRLAYRNNVGRGIGTIIINGINKYQGQTLVNFNIE